MLVGLLTAAAEDMMDDEREMGITKAKGRCVLIESGQMQNCEALS
jgi:hypothetical protein